MTTQIRPVILSGGAGTRLWPASRAELPKQLLPLLSSKTMLQETVQRVMTGALEVLPPVIICAEDHRFLIAQQLQDIGCDADAVVLEPIGRNTAPAALVAALRSEDRDEVLLVLPADHHIEDINGFHGAVAEALPFAASGKLVTFGVVPDRPETGYGYIRQGAALSPRVNEVAAFVEKPDAATAASYIQDKAYLWNSGIFMFTPAAFIAEVEQFEPAMLKAARAALDQAGQDVDFLWLDKDGFAACPSAPIDTAIMERSDKVVVLPIDIGWSDVGSWAALWAIGKKDGSGNVTMGDVMTLDTSNCYVRSEHKVISTIGVNDLVIVETDNAILVCDQEHAQKVKDVVSGLTLDNRDEARTHRKVHRPWGWYDSIEAGPEFQVKVLHIYPGAMISLQYHEHRSEHWVVVDGVAEVHLDGVDRQYKANESVFVAPGVHHRLANNGDTPLTLIEVQHGSYLGEDDIFRLEDKYNRT